MMVGKPVRQWKSVCKGLILGGLLTTCMILLYCLSAPEVHFGLQEVPVPFSCAHRPSPAYSSTISNSSYSASGQRACSPKMDVMFLKTHKTASSTFLNILFRFGEKHHLKFAFPNSRNDFFYPSPFHHSQVKDCRPGMCFNIICNHMRFNAAEVAKVLPADTSYITILRNPADLAESSFHYFGNVVPLTWKLSGEDKLEEFLTDPDLYYDPEGFNSFYLKNLLFFDFGEDNNLDPNDPKVEVAIDAIAKRFQLVMIVEYFEESLILLKAALCWDMEDLVFLNSTRGKVQPFLD
ncbi:Galactosylceramide sulfotransferase [Triplophysa tibetana]|uniref:Galactosylceramide sulfotransferase n=1 Tax=Triplophysa tibetana TaxID=1572043 RepID=A0A5A9P6Q9_9TELE|nr:Galactosylceramide sulfotransferase [Triplophysa tibetana]